jgi:putative FmdB family regulatory protein
MPTYEYECTKCGHAFEVSQKISDPPRKRCPKCSGKVIRLISGGGGVILKGPGFYATDYRGDDYKKRAEAEKAGSHGPKKPPKKKKSK